MKLLLAVGVCVIALAGMTAAVALGGEIKGPPPTTAIPGGDTNSTAALDHANSACAASGLNDMDSLEGQTESKVQTAADSWRYYGLPKGSVGTWGLCRGGTGER